MNTAHDYTRSTPWTPADRAVRLHATIAAAGRAHRNAMGRTPQYDEAEQLLDMAEPAYAAAVPTTHRGATLKLAYVARHVATLAAGRAGHPTTAAARALRLAIRELVPGKFDAMPALRRAVALCREVLDAAATVPMDGYEQLGLTQLSGDERDLLVQHLETALKGLSRPRVAAWTA